MNNLLVISNILLVIFNIGLILLTIWKTIKKSDEVENQPEEPEQQVEETVQETAQPKKRRKTFIIKDGVIILTINDKIQELITNKRRKSVIQKILSSLDKSSMIIKVKVGDKAFYFSSLYYAAFLFDTSQSVIERIFNGQNKAKTDNDEPITIEEILLNRININLVNSYEPVLKKKDIKSVKK